MYLEVINYGCLGCTEYCRRYEYTCYTCDTTAVLGIILYQYEFVYGIFQNLNSLEQGITKKQGILSYVYLEK